MINNPPCKQNERSSNLVQMLNLTCTNFSVRFTDGLFLFLVGSVAASLLVSGHAKVPSDANATANAMHQECW